jgi:hypothetical protein
MLLWRDAGRRGTARVPLSLSAVARTFAISRATAARGLDALGAAGLVHAERRLGAKAIVTLLPAPVAMPPNPLAMTCPPPPTLNARH